MIRDFTEETLNEFLDKIKTESLDGVIDNIELTKEVAGENCILHLPEINDYINSVQRFLKGNQKTYATYKRILEKIFAKARNKDKETGETVTSKIAEIMDPYKESMSQLVACIDVSSLGDTESLFKYNRGYYHSKYDNSVFGSPGNFIKKIHEVKGGAYTRLFYSVNDYEHNEEELENLKKLIHMEPSEFDSYEAAVLLKLFNNCIGYTGTTTNYETNRAEIKNIKNEIDYEKLSYLVTLCYKENDDYNMYDTNKYTLSPNVKTISNYYDNYYQKMYYTNGGLSEEITPYANTNAILNNLCENYSQVETQPTSAYANDKYAHEDGLGRWTKDFAIVIQEESVNDKDSTDLCITIDTNEYSSKNDKTYIQKMETDNREDDKFKDAINITLENLKVNTFENSFSTAVNGGCNSGVDYVAGMNPYTSLAKTAFDLISGPYNSYKESKKYNERIDKYQDGVNLNKCISDLGMDYNLSIYKDTLNYNNLTYNENKLMMRVAYYNSVMGLTGEEAITTEDAKNYFQEYLNGDKDNLEDFDNIVSGNRGNHTPNKNYKGVSVDEFERNIENRLDEGITSTTATPEQMEEAIKKTMLDYESGNE